ncbi:MAG: membrane integrity-associated transporter subunit PqiC [Alphaproteobacteria bacterium]|nr:membrane integrity-associated transporter subunit PqiC [Alphaproteobacteria bacterium]
MFRPAAILLAVSLCAACAGAPPPKDNFYRLEVPSPAQAAPRPILPGVLEVSRLGADGLASERAIVHVDRGAPLSVRNYAYEFWTDPPGLLVQDALVKYLRAANAAETVLTSDLRALPDTIVQGHIRRFERITGDRPAVVAEIELGVSGRTAGKPILLRTYRVERPVPADGGVAAAAQAMNEALAELFGRFVSDLAAVASRA